MSFITIFDLARRVNREVNTRVNYVADQTQYGEPELWREAVTAGDCEDYALAKFAALRVAGLNLWRLRLACVFVETGEYHAVLVVACEDGDWVLDNRFDEVFATFAEKNYRLDKIWNHEMNAWEAA